MRYLLRSLLFAGLLLLLSSACFAVELSEPRHPCHFEHSDTRRACLAQKSVPASAEGADPSVAGSLEMVGEDDWLEQHWNHRVPDGTVSFSFLLTDCGKTVLCQTAQGALDSTYRFEHTDWSHFSMWNDEEGIDGGTSYGFDPFGDNAVLRVRCFLYQEEGTLFVCRCCEITGQNGVLMHRGINTHIVSGDQQTYLLRFESFPAATSPAEDPVISAEEAAQSGNAAEPVTVTRCWTYLSSDDRLLWQVALTGCFLDGRCESADGYVTVFDDAWVCEDVNVFPYGDFAVVRVTLRRRALGIPVARQSYEFRMTFPDPK